MTQFYIASSVVLSIMAGVTYRMGGSGNYPRWIREVGLCVAMITQMIILGQFHWTLILCAGLLYAASTTYFKKKGSDAKWWNWLMVGIAFSISMLPLVVAHHLWIGFIIRTVICSSLIVFWSETNGNAVCEEFGRGVIPIATLPLLIIGA